MADTLLMTCLKIGSWKTHYPLDLSHEGNRLGEWQGFWYTKGKQPSRSHGQYSHTYSSKIGYTDATFIIITSRIITLGTRIRSSFGGFLKGNWTPRNQYEEKFAPGWSLGLILWDPIASEPPSNITLDVGFWDKNYGSAYWIKSRHSTSRQISNFSLIEEENELNTRGSQIDGRVVSQQVDHLQPITQTYHYISKDNGSNGERVSHDIDVTIGTTHQVSNFVINQLKDP